ncbi:MAG: LapA family protein [Verrucomicrobiota bacterium]
MNKSTKIRLGIAAALAVVAVIWILQNGDSVETKFLFATATMSQALLLSITFLIGLATGILLALGMSGKWNKKKETKS